MFLPIETHDLLFAMFELIAIGLGIWMMFRARGVPRLAAAPVRNRFKQHRAGCE